MKNLMMVLAGVAVLLGGCSKSGNSVRVTAEKPTPVAPIAKARSEPIFYNGKTYQLDFVPGAGGVFAMTVAGMSGKQQKDAVAVATSSLRYFACPDGKTGKLLDAPSYVEAKWKMSARCA